MTGRYRREQPIRKSLFSSRLKINLHEYGSLLNRVFVIRNQLTILEKIPESIYIFYE